MPAVQSMLLLVAEWRQGVVLLRTYLLVLAMWYRWASSSGMQTHQVILRI